MISSRVRYTSYFLFLKNKNKKMKIFYFFKLKKKVLKYKNYLPFYENF